MKDKVIAWLSNGADLMTGVRLYLKYADNIAFRILVERMPEAVKPQLFDALVRLGGVADAVLIESQRRFYQIVKQPKFRERWQFLDDPKCPSELKILAADKITAWRSYAKAHARLCECTTLQECYDAAKEAVENFMENDVIRKEFEYYAEHKHILGLHPIFAQRKKIEILKAKGPVWLEKRRGQLEHTIWRTRHNIATDQRTDLQNERKRSLRLKENELDEVKRLLAIYE